MKPLSKRQKEIAHLMIMGETIKEISTALFISEETVKNHRIAVLKKTSCKNAAHLGHSFFMGKINL